VAIPLGQLACLLVEAAVERDIYKNNLLRDCYQKIPSHLFSNTGTIQNNEIGTVEQ